MAGLVEKSICALWRVAVLTVQVGWAPQYTRTKASWTGPELDDVSPATGLSSDWLFDWLRMARYTEYSLTFPAALDGASHDKWAPSAFWFIQTGNKIKFYCYCTFFCPLERGGEKDALPESCQTTELRSFRRKVDSPDRVRQEMSRFARWPTTLYNIVNIPVEVLLKLPLDSACEVTVFLCLFPFSGLKNDKYASGESTQSGRTAIARTDFRAKRLDTKPLDHRSPNCWTSQYYFFPPNLVFESKHPFFCKPMVINKPAVASARLLDIGSKLYPSNMPCMLSNYLTRITQGLSRVRKNRSGERKPLLTGRCYWRPTEKVFKPDYSTKLESCT